jgi:hypothetical protein
MNPPRADGRRCLAVDELEAAGFRRNARGYWELAAQVDEVRARKAARDSAFVSGGQRAR